MYPELVDQINHGLILFTQDCREVFLPELVDEVLQGPHQFRRNVVECYCQAATASNS
jgi:hypothetical protein